MKEMKSLEACGVLVEEIIRQKDFDKP